MNIELLHEELEKAAAGELVITRTPTSCHQKLVNSAGEVAAKPRQQ